MIITGCVLAQHCCKCDQPFRWETSLISFSYIPNPLIFLTPKFVQLIMSSISPDVQNLVKICSLGFPREWVKDNTSVIFSSFLFLFGFDDTVVLCALRFHMMSMILSGLLLINIKQELSALALSSILMSLCLPDWKSRGISCGLKSDHPVYQLAFSASLGQH